VFQLQRLYTVEGTQMIMNGKRMYPKVSGLSR